MHFGYAGTVEKYNLFSCCLLSIFSIYTAMNEDISTLADSGPITAFKKKDDMPVILAAYHPSGTVATDRCTVYAGFIVGRKSTCGLAVADERLSGNHFKFCTVDGMLGIEDLGSRNGTFLNGNRVDGKMIVPDNSVIRAGRCVFVFHRNGGHLLSTPMEDRFGWAGGFHTAFILEELREASISKRNILVNGPTGTGKEMAASTIATMLDKQLFIFNAARIASKEEASSTLFGVASRFFSNVDARPGLIESASGNVLFIDEVHNLPENTQRALLRVMETKETSRIGETVTKQADVRFVLASNEGGDTKGLAHDLYARLRIVTLPPLSERRADIPEIFVQLLKHSLQEHKIPAAPVIAALGADHFEALCLDGFESDNVRGLTDLTDRIATRIAVGRAPKEAIVEVLGARLNDSPAALRGTGVNEDAADSKYDRNKAAIIEAYRVCKGNISLTEARLKTLGISCSRRWLSVFLERWGVKIPRP